MKGYTFPLRLLKKTMKTKVPKQPFFSFFEGSMGHNGRFFVQLLPVYFQSTFTLSKLQPTEFFKAKLGNYKQGQ